MRVIYLHTNIWGSPSPSSVFVTYYTEALAGAGTETELVVMGGGGDIADVNGILADYFGLQPRENWRITVLASGIRHTHRRRREYYKAVKDLLKLKITTGDTDVIITRSLSLLPIIMQVRGKLRRPKVFFESHDFFSSVRHIEIFKGQDWKNYIRERIFLPQAEGLICLQQAQMELYREKHIDVPIYHLPSGCREMVLSERSGGELTLVYVGSLDFHKGIGDLLNLWRGWRAAPRLMIIGGRGEKSICDFKERILKYGLADRIELIPWQRPRVLPEYLKRGDIGLLPLRDTFFNRYLTFPLKMMDYMSAGLPVIARKLPATEAVLGHNSDSVLLHKFEREEFIQAVEKIRNDKDFFDLLKRNIRVKAKEYSWRKRAEKTMGIFK